MKPGLRILFLGEPSSANTLTWVDGLRQMGCKVWIASARSDGSDGAYPIGSPTLPPRARVLTGADAVKELIERFKPDVLLAYRVTSYGYLAACTGFHPLVLAAQNEQITYMPRQSYWRKKMLDYFATYAIKRADLIHAWGNNIKRGLMDFGAEEEKILVMHRGIDLGVFHPGDLFRPVNTESPVFISTRSLMSEYLIDLLLLSFSELLKRLPKAKLVIIGDGDEKKNLVNMAEELGITDSIEFTGRMASYAVAEELRKADFYISLIQTEGISSSLIEAEACGIIPIVADISASRELVDDGENGVLLKDYAPENIASAMKDAVFNGKMAEKAYAKAEWIHQNYDRQINLRRFTEEYFKLPGIERDRKFHVCHITTSHLANDVRIFQRECCGLAKMGYQVSIIARHELEEEVDGVRIIPVKYMLGRLGRKFVLPKLAVMKANELKADIYHFHDPELLPWMCMLVKQQSAKVIWDAHELHAATIKEFHVRHFSPLAWALSKFFTDLEKLWCKGFAAVIAVTDPIRDRYRSMGFECETIRNVIDLDRMPKIKKVAKNHDFTVVSSGTTNNSRCINQLIDAFGIVNERYPDSCLRLLARFDSWEDEQRIKAYIEKKRLTEFVRISLLVPWRQLMTEELPKAHVGVVLYQKSDNNMVGLPNRLFEYWACKLPVVATNTPLLKKVVEDAGAGQVVDTDDTKNLADALIHYLEHPDKARIAGSNGYQAVLERYNWNHELIKLTAMYEKILT